MATATGQKNLIDIASGIPPRNAATLATVSAPTAYAAPTPAQSTPVTSAAATDLDDAAAALATLVSEVGTLTTRVNDILTLLQNCGLRN